MAMTDSDHSNEDSPLPPPPIPWRRVLRLLRPMWRGVSGMVALSIVGVLIGLVPPLALGTLVNALVEHNDKPEGLLLAGLIALAVLLEATAYVLSDGMYARNASRLYRTLRMQMFAGALRRSRRGEDTSGLPSRFISDAETIERITMSLLDTGAMTVVEFVSAVVALGILEPWSVVAVMPLLAGTWIVTRRSQEPAASAGQHRQEELELMTRSISQELRRSEDIEAPSRFRTAVERVMNAEVRYGWLQALNLQGSGGLAKLGPIAVVVVAAFAGVKQAGTLVALYLLAQRTFWGFDGAVDLSLGMQSVRGGVARCFELIDTPSEPSGETFAKAA
jgi:ABC-type multidrug transport system fused ATPase/permease subunit